MLRNARPFQSLAVAILISACAAEPSAPAIVSSVGVYGALAQAELRAAQSGRRTRGVEDELLRIENRVRGFGGLSLDPVSGRLVVYVAPGTAESAVRAALQEAVERRPELRSLRSALSRGGNIELRESDFSFSELVGMQLSLLSRSLPPGVSGLDANEGLNRLVVSVNDAASAASALKFVSDAGVPTSAAQIEIRPTARAAANLRDQIRPLGGGVQIKNETDNDNACTLGFIVDVEFYGERGFLTAAHCRRDPPSTVGDGGLSTYFSQHRVVWFPGPNRVGQVTINPAFTLTAPDCGGYSDCTLADVLFATRSGVSLSDMPKRVVGNAAVPPANTAGSLTINASWSGFVKGLVIQGDSVDKVGRTTGRTRGVVTSTCEAKPVRVDDTPVDWLYMVTCTEVVSAASAGLGDSGAPVWFNSTVPEALGILFAAGVPLGATTCTSNCFYYFSGWDAIEAHLGRYFTP